MVYLVQEGIEGFEIRSTGFLFLAVLFTLFIVAAIYYEIQVGALAVYITIWIAASALLYDELRWRGAKSLTEDPRQVDGKRRSWLIPWQSVRMVDWNGRTLWFTSTGPSRKLSVTFNRGDVPLVEKTLNSNGVRYSWRGPRLPLALTRFSTAALLLFITGQVILIFAALLPYLPGEQQAYTTILSNTRSEIAGATFIEEFRAIFLNNFQVAWGGAIPFLGAFTFGVANYNTGRVLQAIAITSQPQLPPLAVLVALYLLPHTWIEESAYPIATVAGMFAVTRWRSVSPAEFARKRSWGSTKLAFALGGVGLILVVAGFIETLTNYVGYDIMALWVPLALLYYAWAKSRKRETTQLVSSP